MRGIIFLLIFFKIGNLLGCTCATFSKYYEYENSNYVFIGEVIESNREYYTIVVFEVFKGEINVNDTLLLFNEPCSINPAKNEVWLIYGEYLNEKLIASECGYSVNINNPIGKNSYIPKPSNVELTDSEEKEINKYVEENAISELQSDLFWLRSESVKNEQKQIRKLVAHSNFQNTIIICGIALIIFLLSWLIFQNRKKL